MRCSLTEQEQLVLAAGVPLVPAELPLDLIVDPASLLGLRTEAASPHGAQSHSSRLEASPSEAHTHTHAVANAARRPVQPPDPPLPLYFQKKLTYPKSQPLRNHRLRKSSDRNSKREVKRVRVLTAVCITSVLPLQMGKSSLCNTTIAERREELLFSLPTTSPTSSLWFRWSSGRGGGDGGGRTDGRNMAEFHFRTQPKMRKQSAAAILSQLGRRAQIPPRVTIRVLACRSRSVISGGPAVVYSQPHLPVSPSLRAASKGTTRTM